MRATQPEAQRETEITMSRYKAYEAMMFAREAHKYQVRRYTGNPYVDHLAEVCGSYSPANKRARVEAAPIRAAGGMGAAGLVAAAALP